MKYLVFIVLLGLLLFSSCEQTVFVDGDEFEKRIAVWSEIQQDSLPRIYLTYTRSFYDYIEQQYLVESINQAQVVIKGNGISDTLSIKFFTDMNLNTHSYYEGHYPILKDQKYTLEAKTVDDKVSSSMELRDIPNIKLDAVDTVYQYPSGAIEAGKMIRFQDEVGIGNHYRLSFFYRTPGYKSNPQGYTVYDTAVLMGPYPVTYSDVALEDGGVYNFFVEPIYKTDPMTPQIKEPTNVYFVLESISPELGDYLYSAKEQSAHNGDFKEPFLLKSNIKGGVGAFGGYSVIDTLVVRFYP